MRDKISFDYIKTNKTYEEVQKEARHQIVTKDYSNEYILREFNKRENVRQIYLCLVSKNPARVHDIFEISKFTDNTSIRRALHGLRKLGLVNQIPVFSLMVKKGRKTGEEGIILKDFKNWTSKMSPRLKQKYQSITCYWALTEKGRDPNLINQALIMERGATQNG